MQNIHRLALSPTGFVQTLIAADKRWAKKLIDSIREQLAGDESKKKTTNKPFGRGKETGDGGQHCSVFIATSREDGSVLTSYSEAKRRNPDSTPDVAGQEYVFINLRQQKSQGAAAGVDPQTMADVAALADAAAMEVADVASELDDDAELDALIGG